MSSFPDLNLVEKSPIFFVVVALLSGLVFVTALAVNDLAQAIGRKFFDDTGTIPALTIYVIVLLLILVGSAYLIAKLAPKRFKDAI